MGGKHKAAANHPGYRTALHDLQVELVKLQRHIIKFDHRFLVILEGRDTAGKDGAIKRIVEHLSPRETRVVALGKPSDHDTRSWYFQRYVPHLPSSQEMVLMNRSWYNRAGVEYVMGFCSTEQHARFLELCPEIEQYMVEGGIILIKFWLEVGQEEQERRFAARIDDPLRQWKLSPMDVESYRRWYDYSRARDMMLKATDSKYAPWHVVRSNDKRKARLNCISHLLEHIPHKRISRDRVKLPSRSDKGRYNDELKGAKFVAERY